MRYHGVAPLVSHLLKGEYIEARAYKQNPVFEAAITLARSEGIIIAPEAAHAAKAAIDEALLCKKSGDKKVIVFNLSGHGLVDMTAYDAYLAGKLTDHEHPEHEIQKALKTLPTMCEPE